MVKGNTNQGNRANKKFKLQIAQKIIYKSTEKT